MSLKGHLAMSADIFWLSQLGVLPASSGSRPGVLLSTFNERDTPAARIPFQNASSAVVEKLWSRHWAD